MFLPCNDFKQCLASMQMLDMPLFSSHIPSTMRKLTRYIFHTAFSPGGRGYIVPYMGYILGRYVQPQSRVGQGFWVFGIQGRFKSGIRYIAT